MSDGKRAERSGKWHSAKWWRGHWDLRDACGSYLGEDEALAGGTDTCQRQDGNRKLKRQLDREAKAHERQRKAKQAAPAKQLGRREQLREDMRMGQHAQGLRAENQAMGYKAETAGFYGSDKVAQAEHSERRLTSAQADREAQLANEADQQERAAYNERKRAGGRGKFASWYLGDGKKRAA